MKNLKKKIIKSINNYKSLYLDDIKIDCVYDLYDVYYFNIYFKDKLIACFKEGVLTIYKGVDFYKFICRVCK